MPEPSNPNPHHNEGGREDPSRGDEIFDLIPASSAKMRAASKLVDEIISELGRGNFLPTESQVLYLDEELGRAFQYCFELMRIQASSAESPLVVIDQLFEATLGSTLEGEKPEFLAKQHCGCTWEVDTPSLIKDFTGKVRELLSLGATLEGASKKAVFEVVSSLQDTFQQLISPAGEERWMTPANAIKELDRVEIQAKDFEIFGRLLIGAGQVSPDLLSSSKEDIHSEFARVRLRDYSELLRGLLEQFSLSDALDLDLRNVKPTRDLYKEARDAAGAEGGSFLTGPRERMALAQSGVREALLRRHDQSDIDKMSGSEKVQVAIACWKDTVADHDKRLMRLTERSAPSIIRANGEDYCAYSKLVLSVIEENAAALEQFFGS